MKKERIPYFNFYPTDFMRGVRGLTAQEVGIYTMLLCRMYEENGPVDLHDERLAAYCGCRTSTLVKALSRLCDLGKIVLVGKQIFNERAAIEIDKRNHVVKSNSTAGVLSAEKRKQNQRDIATPVQQTFNHTDTDTDTEDSVAKATDASVDFAKELWDRGVAFLGRNGTPDKQARTLIGKWRKAYTDTDIFEAFAACSKDGVIDPVPWITAKLNGKGKTDGKPHSRGERFLRSFVAGASVAPRVDTGPDSNTSRPLLARG